MKYLTLDNVMDDAVAFLDQVKRNHTGAEDSKVVMASGRSFPHQLMGLIS